MYIVALALNDVMPGDDKHPENLAEFESFIIYQALKKQ
jgi:hypothetical protein